MALWDGNKVMLLLNFRRRGKDVQGAIVYGKARHRLSGMILKL